MALLVVTDDILFGSKFEAFSKHLSTESHMIKNLESIDSAKSGDGWQFAFVDLEYISDDLHHWFDLIRQKIGNARLIGYCSHARTDLIQSASGIGFEAYSKGELIQNLGTLFRNEDPSNN